MTKADIVNEISGKTGMSKPEVLAIVEAFIMGSEPIRGFKSHPLRQKLFFLPQKVPQHIAGLSFYLHAWCSWKFVNFRPEPPSFCITICIKSSHNDIVIQNWREALCPLASGKLRPRNTTQKKLLG